jgi:peptidoglycan/xylan/chitin deacetylase (PgdA/CDA1 family)
MRRGKRFLLSIYCGATLPLRWLWQWYVRRRGRLPIPIVFYHRIADDAATPWTLSHHTFFRQLAWLRRRFELISLAEAQRRLCHGRNHRPCAVITFDDGYRDNCDRAIPFLIEQRIPCTYFVTVENVLTGKPFVHDLLHGATCGPNTAVELRAMAAAGIEVAAHGFSHVSFGQITEPRRLVQETATARRELEELLGRRVRYFAFPFGLRKNLSPEAFAAVRRAGYAAACSAYGGFNYPGEDPFHLQRIGPTENMCVFWNWLTFDPRKLYVPRYDYNTDDADAESQNLAWQERGEPSDGGEQAELIRGDDGERAETASPLGTSGISLPWSRTENLSAEAEYGCASWTAASDSLNPRI